MESLGLDWKVLTAQLVNFGLLFFVLSKLLFKPISKLLDERKKKIEESDVNSKKIEERLLKLEEKEKSVMKKAEERAMERRDELIVIAEKEKEEIIENAKVAAQRESQKAIEQVKSYESQIYTNIRQKVLNEAVDEVVKKLSSASKKNKYPRLKGILSK